MDVLRISLASARVNAGLTQLEASSRIGVSIKTLQNWEKGSNVPNIKYVSDICNTYGVSYENLKF